MRVGNVIKVPVGGQNSEVFGDNIADELDFEVVFQSRRLHVVDARFRSQRVVSFSHCHANCLMTQLGLIWFE